MNAHGTFRLLGLLAAAAAASACGGATLLVNGGPPKLDGPLRAIATTSNRPAFSDQIVASLNGRGYTALDARTSAALTGRAAGADVAPGTINLVEAPDVLARMRALQVDVLLSIEVRMVTARTFAGTQDLLDGVKITAYSMTNPAPAGGIDWKNSWGGMPGSPADGAMRQNEPAAAQILSNEISKLVGAPGPRVVVDADAAVAADPARRKRKKRKKAPVPQDDSAAPEAAIPAAAPAPAAEPAAEPEPAAAPAPEAETASAPEPARAAPRELTASETASIDAELLP